MGYIFRNMVFEGGGVKGIAYVGALEVLRKREILDSIQRVGGTSAGAIHAILLALNYTETEMRNILWSLDFHNFMDDSWGFVRDTHRLIASFGWYKGKFFRHWIGRIIHKKTGNSESTFADLQALKNKKGFRDLYLIGTNLSTHYSEVFSFEHTPRMCVADAARISMSIPLFFTAVRSPRGDVYVDGGMLENYPVRLFDREKYLTDSKSGVTTTYYEQHNASLAGLERPISHYIYNKETLGFRLDSKKEIAVFRDHAEPPHHTINDLFDFLWELVNTSLEFQQNTHLHNDDWQRTIYIDTKGVKTTDFDLSDHRKKELLKSGRDGVRHYFAWYDQADTINK